MDDDDEEKEVEYDQVLVDLAFRLQAVAREIELIKTDLLNAARIGEVTPTELRAVKNQDKE